jgi:hypothetical protein
MLLSTNLDYIEWLKTTRCDLDPHNQYCLLFRDLSALNFVSIVDFDHNRIYEALYYREAYTGDTALPHDTVSMLEIIRTMAIKCEEVSFDAEHTNTVTEWFWQLLGNVGLDKFVDLDYHDLGGGEVVRNILCKIILRSYDHAGVGGLFPLRYPTENQRFIDLFYQMRAYVEENYY